MYVNGEIKELEIYKDEVYLYGVGCPSIELSKVDTLMTTDKIEKEFQKLIRCVKSFIKKTARMSVNISFENADMKTFKADHN